jgi:hypothetical protein
VAASTDPVPRSQKPRAPARSGLRLTDRTANFCLPERVVARIQKLFVRQEEVILLGTVNVQNLGDRSVNEPRELSEGQEQLPISEEEPELLRRDVRNLGVKGVGSKPAGFHPPLRAPLSREPLCRCQHRLGRIGRD